MSLLNFGLKQEEKDMLQQLINHIGSIKDLIKNIEDNREIRISISVEPKRLPLGERGEKNVSNK